MNEFFINCDWGTTHFRLRAICRRGTQIVAEFQSDEGVAHLAASNGSHVRGDVFRAVLSAGLEQLRAAVGRGLATAPVLISGMASSSIGWLELPYAQVPFSLNGADLIWKCNPNGTVNRFCWGRPQHYSGRTAWLSRHWDYPTG